LSAKSSSTLANPVTVFPLDEVFAVGESCEIEDGRADDCVEVADFDLAGALSLHQKPTGQPAVTDTAGLEITRATRLRALGFETSGSCRLTNSLPWRWMPGRGGSPRIDRVQD